MHNLNDTSKSKSFAFLLRDDFCEISFFEMFEKVFDFNLWSSKFCDCAIVSLRDCS